MLRPFYSVLLFNFSFIILSFIIMRTKKMYGIKNESNGIGLVRMYLTTCFKPGFHIVVSVVSVVSVVRKKFIGQIQLYGNLAYKCSIQKK